MSYVNLHLGACRSKQLPPIHTYTSRQKLINQIILLSLLSRCEFGKRINVCCKKASQMLVINCVNTEEKYLICSFYEKENTRINRTIILDFTDFYHYCSRILHVVNWSEFYVIKSIIAQTYLSRQCY